MGNTRMGSAADTIMRSRTGYLLIELGDYVRAGAIRALAPLGFRLRHLAVLVTLVASDQPLSQQEVSRSLGIDPNVMVGLIDDLEELGLAQRQRNPSDRRRHVITVTPAGHSALGEAAARLDAAEAKAFSVIGDDEKAYVHDALDRLLTALASDAQEVEELAAND